MAACLACSPRGGSPSWAASFAAPRPQTRRSTSAPCARPSRPSRWAPSSSGPAAPEPARPPAGARRSPTTPTAAAAPSPRGASSRRSAPEPPRSRGPPSRPCSTTPSRPRAGGTGVLATRRTGTARRPGVSGSVPRRCRRDAPQRPADDDAADARSVLQMTTPTKPRSRARRLRDAARRATTAALAPVRRRDRAPRGARLPAACIFLYDEAWALVAAFAPGCGAAC